MRKAMNPILKRFLGFLPGRNFRRDTDPLMAGNGAAEDLAADEAGSDVNGGCGVENAMDAAWLSEGLPPSPAVSGGVAEASCSVLLDIGDRIEDWAAT
jgi:hypothetical protein